MARLREEYDGRRQDGALLPGVTKPGYTTGECGHFAYKALDNKDTLHKALHNKDSLHRALHKKGTLHTKF